MRDSAKVVAPQASEPAQVPRTLTTDVLVAALVVVVAKAPWGRKAEEVGHLRQEMLGQAAARMVVTHLDAREMTAHYERLEEEVLHA